MGVQTLTHFFQIGDKGQLTVKSNAEAGLARAVSRASQIEAQGTYLNVPFSTLFEYLEVKFFIERYKICVHSSVILLQSTDMSAAHNTFNVQRLV